MCINKQAGVHEVLRLSGNNAKRRDVFYVLANFFTDAAADLVKQYLPFLDTNASRFWYRHW